MMTLLFTLIGTIVFAVVGPASGMSSSRVSIVSSPRVCKGAWAPRFSSLTMTCASFSGKNAFPSTQASSSTSLARCSSRFSRAGSSSAAVTFCCAFSSSRFRVCSSSSRLTHPALPTRRSARRARRSRSWRTSPWFFCSPLRFSWRSARFRHLGRARRAGARHRDHLACVPRPSFHSHDQAAQVAVRSFDVASRSSGTRSRHDHRDERADSRDGRGHALVRDRAVPRVDRHLLRMGKSALPSYSPPSSPLSSISSRSGSTTTSLA